MNDLKKISTKKALSIITLIIFITSVGITALILTLNLRKYKNYSDTEISKFKEEKYFETVSGKFEKAVLTTRISAGNIDYSDQNNFEKTKAKLRNILNSDKNVLGAALFLGDISGIENNESNLLQDTSSNVFITALLKNGEKTETDISNNADFIFSFINIKDFGNTAEVLISEPFYVKTERKKENVIGITAPVKEKTSVTGFLTVLYNTETFTDFTSEKNIKCDYLILTTRKNIVASSGSKFNVGKNILNLHGKENNLYNKLKVPDNNSGSIFKISPENTNAELEFLISCPVSAYNYQKEKNPVFWIIFSVILIAGSLLILFFINKLLFPLKKIAIFSEKISRGEGEKENPENTYAEYGKIISNLNKTVSYNNEVYHFAEEIRAENFDTRIKERSENDRTSKMLNKIAEYLKDRELKRANEEKKVSQQLWMRRGRFEISEAERSGSKNISELSFNIIRSTVNYVNALMGGIYLYDEEKEEAELVAAYAYDKQRHLNTKFKKGEGLVGACVTEKKKIILNKIPEDYIKAATGLGSGTPSYLALIPVFFKNKINSVIEIAFMSKPEDYKIEFIEQLSDNIGSWIDASITGTKTAKLLEISQKQTQKLAEKEEELNKKVIELQEIQEKTAEINTRFKSILSAVNKTIMTVEYTLDGTIINCNSVYTEVMGFTADDIRGKNVVEIVKDQSESLKKIIEDVKSGKTIKKEVKRYTKLGEEKQLTATYTPYYNKDGKITHILFFAFDISDLKLK